LNVVSQTQPVKDHHYTLAVARVVEHFDIIEDVLPAFFPAFVDSSLDSLTLLLLEKTLSDCIVMAIATTTHTANPIVCF
jgi:hypothetical protein